MKLKMQTLIHFLVLTALAHAQARTCANTVATEESAALMQSTVMLAQAPTTAQTPAPSAPTKTVGKPMRAATAPAANAKVIAAPAGLDFGVVAPHTLLEGNFKLVNTSDNR